MSLDTDYSVQFEARPHHFSLGGIYEPGVTQTCITTSEQSLVLKCRPKSYFHVLRKTEKIIIIKWPKSI